MTVEKRQDKLAKNTEAMERELARLVRIVNRINVLRFQRKRLLGPKKPREIKYRSLDDIRMAAGGNEFNDDLPI
jgi:hypothetical protein